MTKFTIRSTSDRPSSSPSSLSSFIFDLSPILSRGEYVRSQSVWQNAPTFSLSSSSPPSSPSPIHPSSFIPHPSRRRPLRLVLLGDRDDVIETIKNLHQREFAPAGEWSRAIACPHAGELIGQMLTNLSEDSVISILTRYLH